MVTLTELGAQRIGLQTEAIATRSGGTSIPYASVLYDADEGQPYVFVNTDGLDFQRADVTIEKIELTPSTCPGTAGRHPCRDRGPAQVHGAELEYGAY